MPTKIEAIQAKYGVTVLTGPLPQDFEIAEVAGLVNGIAIYGANFVKDFFANIADKIGGRVSGYERAAQGATDAALEQMVARASALGADAVIYTEIDNTSLGRSILMATTYGTAVRSRRKEVPEGAGEPRRYLHEGNLG